MININGFPINFKGLILGVKFYIVNQLDIENNANFELTDTKTNNVFAIINKYSKIETIQENILDWLKKNDVIIKEEQILKFNRQYKPFISELIKDIKVYNKTKNIKKPELKNKNKPMAKKTKKLLVKKKPIKKYKLPSYNIKLDKMYKALKPGKRISNKGNVYYEYRQNRADKVPSKFFGSLNDLFDTKTIKNLDDLKRQYYNLAKKYHPDSGGTNEQFQELQKNYQINFNKLLKEGTLNKEQQENEIIIDKAIRDIIDNIINLENITIEVIGKWLWVGGNTYPLKTILKNVGLVFIKKENVPYWVYKGTETSSRGKMSIEDIKKKYGSNIVKAKPISKIGSLKVKINKTKIKNAFLKLTKALNKRYV